MANASFLPTLPQYDIVQAAQVYHNDLQSYLPDHVEFAADTASLFSYKCWFFRRAAPSSAGAVRHPKAIRGLGFGNSFLEPRGLQCEVLRCTYRAG